MALTALGQTLQLVLSSVQLQDLADGLTVGDTLRGRVVEVMDGQKAIVNFKGVNVVAELKADLAQALQKGDILMVKVTGLPAQASGAAAGNVQNQGAAAEQPGGPTLALQLLQRQPVANAGEAMPSATLAQPSPQAPLTGPSPDMGALLRQLNVPETGSNLAAARALASHGLPVTSEQIKQVVETAQNLQNQAAEFQPAAADQAPLPAVPREILTQAKALLSLMDAQSPPVQRHLEIQQALRALEQIGVEDANSGAKDNSLVGQSSGQRISNPVQAEITSPSLPSQETGPAPAQTYAQGLGGALQQLAQDPAGSLGALLTTLSQAREQIQTLGTAAANNFNNEFAGNNAPANPLNAGLPLTAGASAPLGQAQALSANAAGRALAAQAVQARVSAEMDTNPPPAARNLIIEDLLGSLQPSAQKAVTSADLAQAARQEVQALANPGSELSQNIQNLASTMETTASRQAPGNFTANQIPAENAAPDTSQSVLDQARQFLGRLAESFETNPSPQAFDSQAAMRAELGNRGFTPAPPILAGLPREAVTEAVVFLQARGLPASPALAAPVALALTLRNGTVGQMAAMRQNIGGLSPELLQAKPELKQAVLDFSQLYDSQGVKPDSSLPVSVQLGNLLNSSGLKLEAQLARALNGQGQGNNQPPAPPTTKTDMKAALLNLQDQVSKAQADPGLDASTRSTLAKASEQAQATLSSLTTQQLVNQPLPSRDWVSFHLPVWFGQAVVPGQLSVYWKKGAEPRLSDQDPLNVVFSLDTRGLGPVKAHLAVYKSECFCSVKVGRQDSLNLIQDHLAELKDSFNSNTPFKLSRLDASLDQGGDQPFFPDNSPFQPSNGVSLSA